MSRVNTQDLRMPLPESTADPDAPADLLLGVIAELVGVLDLDEFRLGLLQALRRAVPADWIALNDIGPAPESTVVLIEPEFPPDAHELYARYAHHNPLLVRYQRTGDGRAYRFSDVATAQQLHDTALYREFYAPIGLEHQIAFTLPHESDRVLALALSRRDRDFSDEERELLNRARPFLIQAYNNALEHSGLKAELEHRTREPKLPVTDPWLAVQLAERGVTLREAEVLGLIAAGLSDSAAAARLGIGERTVQKHLQHCYGKLGVHSRSEAAAFAWALVGDRRRMRAPDR
jgi:DNA-binding CsgD family transcriptional regulator